jgi:hypothetical protein
MSIFPKRIGPGETVTIHLNIFARHKEKIIFPYIRSVIHTPTGKEALLFDGYTPCFPASGTEPNLNKEFPFLLIANQTRFKSEDEVNDIITRIASGTHYYFQYTLPPDAEPGKYEVETELWIDGIDIKSTTNSEDFFHVEKIDLLETVNHTDQRKARIINHSPEPMPARLIKVRHAGSCESSTLQLAPLTVTEIFFRERAFLLYNEERKCLSLDPLHDQLLIRNQKWFSKEATEEVQRSTYAMHADNGEVVILTGKTKELWDNADKGIDMATPEDKEFIKEMRKAGLLDYVKLSTHDKKKNYATSCAKGD